MLLVYLVDNIVHKWPWPKGNKYGYMLLLLRTFYFHSVVTDQCTYYWKQCKYYEIWQELSKFSFFFNHKIMKWPWLSLYFKPSSAFMLVGCLLQFNTTVTSFPGKDFFSNCRFCHIAFIIHIHNIAYSQCSVELCKG